MSSDILIDETNFSEYFREVGKSMPTNGDALVAFRALAYFSDGHLKREICHFLCYEFGSVMKCIGRLVKHAGASKFQSVCICRQIISDLLSGMPLVDVYKKEYEFHFEKFYYAKPEYVPTDDKRWQILKLPNQL